MIYNRRAFLRSAVAGSMLMPAILHELLAGDAPPLHFPGALGKLPADAKFAGPVSEE